MVIKQKISNYLNKLIFSGSRICHKAFTGIFKKSFIAGIDFGADSIKFAQFNEKEDGLHLVSAGIERIKSKDSKQPGDIEIASALKRLLSGVSTARGIFIANINCPGTSAREVTLPFISPAELVQAIRLKAKDYFTFFDEGSSLDYEIAGDVVEGGVRKHKLLVAVSPKATVNKYLSILARTGIKPFSFKCLPVALKGLLGDCYRDSDKVMAFLDIGKRFSEIVVFGGKSLIFSRKIPVAGDDFTKALTAVLVSERGKTALTFDEAEKIKCSIGIPQDPGNELIDGKISSAQVLSLLRAPLTQLSGEISRCFDYYREETGGKTINSLTLLGAGAKLAGLEKFLSDELGLEVNFSLSCEVVKIDKGARELTEKDFHRIAPAFGAALAGPGGINLLPREIKEEAARRIIRTTIAVAVSLLLFIPLLTYIGMRIQLGVFEKRITAAHLELANLEPALKATAAGRLAQNVFADEPYWTDVFRELSNIIPDGVYLSQMSMRGKVIRVKGIITLAEKEKIISDFMNKLEEGLFRNVRLIVTKESANTLHEFELSSGIE
ncbi:MAG: hypothetical protein COV72_07395 [Candidatus Omnitrophica bacterium CG11_big_fil_rev_8_21_14_0_20_42_13]|uniref:SHS2 domain-containing protein n=1 Tax=Candidatus Ghiorseimicrobium undicola TaxID=1974746 RepID=A0A2H0LW49_9BACT|nr:MAG: hypothetical protein COV72_07395 [Candidatus Omnitrophica bacterium CG11_big_fil_rev_8_21_14_0_20_42_13]